MNDSNQFKYLLDPIWPQYYEFLPTFTDFNQEPVSGDCSSLDPTSNSWSHALTLSGGKSDEYTASKEIILREDHTKPSRS